MLRRFLLVFVPAAVVIFVLRLPFILAPVSDNDEGIYASIGQYLFQGEVLYRDVWDNKLPAIYFLFGLVSTLTHDPLFFRVVGSIFLLTAGALAYYLALKIFSRSQANFALVLFSLLSAVPIIETQGANAEIFFLPLTTAGVVLTILIEWFSWSRRWYLLAGFLLGVGALFKVVVLFDALAILTILLIRHFYRIHKELTFLIIGGLAAFAIPVAYILTHGLAREAIQAAILNNVGYVSYGNSLKLGPLSIGGSTVVLAGKLALVGAAIFLIKRSFGPKDSPALLIYAWFAWTLFAAFFSGHPYPHYLIQAMIAAVLVLADQFGKLWPLKKLRHISGFSLLKTVTVAAVIFAAITWDFGSIFGVDTVRAQAQHLISSYVNEVKYQTGQMGRADFYSSYGDSAIRNYTISDYVKAHTTSSDSIFVWGNSPWIYYLSNRPHASKYLVAYHFDLTPGERDRALDLLKTTPPKIIVVVHDPSSIAQIDNPPSFPAMDQFIRQSYQYRQSLNSADIYELGKFANAGTP